MAKANEPEASFYEELAMHDLFKGVWNVRTHLKKKTVSQNAAGCAVQHSVVLCLLLAQAGLP